MDEVQNLFLKASTAYGAGKHDQARDLLRQVIRQRPDHIQAILLFCKMAENEEAQRRCFEQVQRHHPDDPRVAQVMKHHGYPISPSENKGAKADAMPPSEDAPVPPDAEPEPDTTPTPEDAPVPPDIELEPDSTLVAEDAPAPPDAEPEPDATPAPKDAPAPPWRDPPQPPTSIPPSPEEQPPLPPLPLPQQRTESDALAVKFDALADKFDALSDEVQQLAETIQGMIRAINNLTRQLPRPDSAPGGSRRSLTLPAAILILAATILILACVLLATLIVPDTPCAEPTPVPSGTPETQPTEEETSETSGFVVLYDFVEQAPTASWTFYTPTPQRKTYAEVSKYPITYTLGTARLWDNAQLEDGQRYPRVLETRPPATPSGEIWGGYDLGHISLQAGDYFFAQVGFLEGAFRGDVNFRIHFESSELGAPVVAISSLTDHYDWQDPTADRLKNWQVLLPPDLGTGIMYLEVDSNSTVFQDRAVWIKAEIRRPTSN